MFKYFQNTPNEESVYKLVSSQQVSNNGNTGNGHHDAQRKNGKWESRESYRYRSIHSSMVREEADKNKAWSAKTMGVPRLPIEGPDMFLKKHSKRPLSMRPKSVSACTFIPCDKGCQTHENEHDVEETTGETDFKYKEDENVKKQESSTIHTSNTTDKARPKTCYQRLCSNTVKKPPIPESNLGVNFVIQDTKDFVRSNALSAISTRPSKPKEPIVYVDNVKGDTREWQNSGLAPNYVHKKKFAQVPVYITLRKKEFLEQIKKKQDEEQAKASSSQVRILDNEERNKMIEGLKQNWNQIFSNYQRLPLLIDTPGKIKRKTGMEEQMKKLETDIQTLQRHDCIYVSDIAPRSFYAFDGNGDKKHKAIVNKAKI